MTVDKLDTGLTVVTVPFSAGGATAFYTLVRAGSRDEVEVGKSGYAHLFEHLMFRGTEKVPAADYEKRMQALGSDNNAFTTDDFTMYTPMIPKESLGELIDLEADRFQHLTYSPAAYKDETGAVLGEFNKDFSNPWWQIDEAIRELAFKKHTYGHTVIGYKKDVVAMPNAYDYSRTFFKRFYTPDDAVIFVVGDVDRAKVLEQVKKAYTGWTTKRAETKTEVEPEQTEARRKDLVWKSPTTPRLAIGWKVPQVSASMRDAAALGVIAALAFGEPSELYQRVVVKEQRVLELSCDPDDALHKDPGLFRVDAKLKPGEAFDGVLDAIQNTVDALAKGEVDAARLEATKSNLRGRMVLSMQTPDAVAVRLAYLHAVAGAPGSFDALISELAQVTKDDVARAAKYLTTSRRNVVTLVPPKETPKPVAKPDAKGGKK
jgi:zinc protease